ncbi:MAG: hypothetical protein J5J06_06630 [Phycisphaerae bacterium]|nr:hypothetical protein [Phycisphaerae bacterium]
MAVLSDIIIARPDEAGSINAAEGKHLQRWPSLESKGIDTVKLGTLSKILMDRPVNDVDAVASFMLDAILDEASEDGPWVFQVPDELVAAVAALDSPTIDRVAQAWAATEEFQLSRWSERDVREYMRDLVTISARARAEGKTLLLWMSL